MAGSLASDVRKEFEEKPFPELSIIAESYSSAKSAPEVLCVGDSVFHKTAHEDTDKRTLSKMITDEVNQFSSSLSVSYGAYHSGVFYRFARLFERLPAKPKLMIFPVNIRCFSPQWCLNPLYQFDSEIAILEEFIKSGKISAPEEIKETEQLYDEFDSTSINFPQLGLVKLGVLRKLALVRPEGEKELRERQKKLFIYHYGAKIDLGHVRLKSFKDILTKLDALGIKVMLFMGPYNYFAALNSVGDEFAKDLLGNSRCVHEALGGRAIDWSNAFPERLFFRNDLLTEHLNENGRKLQAELVAEEVRKLI